MCGIIGYTGNKDAVPVLMQGLRRLEYRGYDSAGIAVGKNGNLEIRRAAGKLDNLQRIIECRPVRGTFGIGHTRWATHGKPTAENAHPHQDCHRRIVIVHNGIIENYLELKAALIDEAHNLSTDTDTEVLAHLIEKHYAGDLESAVRQAFLRVKGIYACVVLCKGDTNKLVAVRNGPPLIVGIGRNQMYVASDVSALVQHTHDMLFLDNGEIASITADGVRIETLSGIPVNRPSREVYWDTGMAERGEFQHYMLKEIYEQPLAIRKTVRSASRCFDTLRLDGIEKIQLVAAGSSWHASLIGKYMIEELARIPVEVDIASEFRYRNPIVPLKSLTVAITQSGETADTIAAVREARLLGASTLSISNVADSQITRETTGSICTQAGPEIGVASTKAFTTQLVALYLLAVSLAEKTGRLSTPHAKTLIQATSGTAGLVETILQKREEIQIIAQDYCRFRDFLFIGRGINYPIALEGALKLKEISYLHAEGYPAGELKHGPIALIDREIPVIAIMPGDRYFEKTYSNVQEACARDARVLAIVTEGQLLTESFAEYIIQIPECDPLLTPILTVIPLQLLAYFIAFRLSRDIDHPRNLAKSVTVE